MNEIVMMGYLLVEFLVSENLEVWVSVKLLLV